MTRLFKITLTCTIFTAVFGFACIHASAQNLPVKKLLFESVTINNGLSQGMVNCIVQDHFGFLWFATKDGLNRYDGHHFVVYRHDPSNPASLADSYIETVFEDSKGRLWVGTTSQGLELFHRETEAFQHFRRDPKDPSVSIDHVTAITEDEGGKIWVTLLNGVVVITENKNEKGTTSTFTFRKVTNKESHVFVAQNGTVWISELNGNLFTIRSSKDGKEKVDSIPVSNYCGDKSKSNGYGNYVFAFAGERGDSCLYLFMKNCIARFDEKENTFRIFRLNDPGLVSFNFSAYVINKTIWLVNNFRLQQFDENAGQLTLIEDRNATTRDLAGSANCVYTDRGHVTWIGTNGYGVLKHIPRTEKFHHTDKESIHWMQETNDGTVLLVKEGTRLYLFDKNSGRYTGVIPDTNVEKSPAFKFGVVEAGLQGNEGSYWICKQSMVNYNAGSKTYTRYLDKTSFPIYKDGAGQIWFGGKNSFCFYDNKTKTFTEYDYPVAIQHFPYKFLQAVCQDNKGIFWLGTTTGLLRFDPGNRSWKHFKNNPPDSTSLSFDLIFSLCPDPLQPNKYLWIGTNGGGLNCFDMQSGKVVRYSSKDGLANDVVYGILSDKEGNLWMSTNNGLSKLAGDRRSFINYNEMDGLQGNEFNRNAFCKTTDGTLFFGGVNGFNFFDPAEIQDNSTVPNLLITGFKIGNQPVSFQSNNSPLSKPVYLTDKIILPYDDNMISFDFVVLDFTNPGKNLYQYKLEGFDKGWIYSGTEHTATYTNLDPGTYTLQIKGSNSDGVWNETGRSLQLVILPPWHMTWWFRTLLALTALSTIYILYRNRLQQALKIQLIRNKIASDLHDEIGSNLSSISIFSDVAKKETEGTPVGNILSKISNYTQESMEAMSDIVWMINASNERFENVINRMRELTVELTEAKQFLLHLDIDERLNNSKLGMEERKNFWLIYKEALNNAVKYSNAKTVNISLQSNNAFITLLVKDDGDGFDLKMISPGNGLKNMRQRATLLKGDLKIISAPGQGTTVELKFKN